jgi:type IV pilus assembly protein PilC
MTDSPPTDDAKRETGSLSVTLRMFAEESRSPFFAAALSRLSDDLNQGVSWSDALARHGWRLPRFLRGVFSLAERSGDLTQTLSRYLRVVQQNRRARWHVLSALLYPLVVGLICSTLVGGVLVLIVPGFWSIYDDFGVDLPDLTVAIGTLSRIVIHGWPWILLAIATLLAAAIVLRILSPPVLVRAFQWIPVVGTASWMAGASEFCSLLSIAIQSHMTLPESLKLTADALRDSNLRAGAKKLASSIERGEILPAALESRPEFRPALAQVFRHAGREHQFAEILRAHGELFAVQAEGHSRIAVVWIEPFLMIGIGFGVGLVALGLFLPLVKLLNELS